MYQFGFLVGSLAERGVCVCRCRVPMSFICHVRQAAVIWLVWCSDYWGLLGHVVGYDEIR